MDSSMMRRWMNFCCEEKALEAGPGCVAARILQPGQLVLAEHGPGWGGACCPMAMVCMGCGPACCWCMGWGGGGFICPVWATMLGSCMLWGEAGGPAQVGGAQAPAPAGDIIPGMGPCCWGGYI